MSTLHPVSGIALTPNGRIDRAHPATHTAEDRLLRENLERIHAQQGTQLPRYKFHRHFGYREVHHAS